MKIHNSTIKAIFTNLIFVIGIILTIVGFISGSNTIAKLIIFDKYPLNGYEESRCDNDMYAARPMVKDGNQEEISEDDLQKQKELCLENLERDRKVRLVDSVSNSISFFVAGIILSFSFRRFIFDKQK